MSIRGIRSNRAEIKGQLTNEVARLFVDPVLPDGSALPDIGPWTVVEFEGRKWDVVSPPFFKQGVRRTTHWECEVKALPPSDLRGVVDKRGRDAGHRQEDE
ncbi:hypothetical protein [Schaalia sp. ZJ1691]|uniref:hypothetical protein n=1 Tax=Schaalia sp. ZJ1691 TaxID=2709404 RepID=UPI0013ED9087|nr:hypothetical protein [Schaalia sp. ZJ1691]